MHEDAAFTTAELMIVLVIVGVLTAVATPSLHRWLSTIGVDAAARELAATLQLGKMRAIAENRRYRMSFDLAQHSYVVQKEAFKEGAFPFVMEKRLDIFLDPLFFKRFNRLPFDLKHLQFTKQYKNILQEFLGTHDLDL